MISHSVPPSTSGQAIVILRLLGEDSSKYSLISNDEILRQQNRNTGEYRHYSLRVFPKAFKRLDLIPLFGPALRRNLELIARTLQVLFFLIKSRSTLAVGCSGDLYNLPATCLSAKLLGIDFVAYMFDDFKLQFTNSKDKRWSAYFEKRVVLAAKTIIVPNTFLGKRYVDRYSIEPVIISNPLPTVKVKPRNHFRQSTKGKIVYSGAIYEAQRDAIANLAAASTAYPPGEVELHLYTRHFHRYNHWSFPNVFFHEAVTPDEIFQIQKSADILFLPLAFASPYPDLILTSCPGKTAEYLASGIPILAHVPSGSYVEWLLQKNGAGLVVTDPQGKGLKEAIDSLMSDRGLRDRLVKNAVRLAQEEFDLETSRQKFWRTLEDGGRDGNFQTLSRPLYSGS